MKKRNSSVEILRVFSMFLILSGHFYSQSDISLICSGGYITDLLTHGARISVNIFMFITCYFMADVNYKVKVTKVIETYFMLWFYSVVLGITSLIINNQFNYSIIKSFFRFLGGCLWYMTMYISFLLLFQYIAKINNLSKEKHRALSIICLIIFCIYSSIHRFAEGMLAYYGWIVACYICFSFYRRYLEPKIKMRYIVVSTITGLIGYLALVYINSNSNSEVVTSYTSYYLREMTTLPNTFMALSIVLLATRINIGNVNYINKISGCMGAVYIVHQVEVFYTILWRIICSISRLYMSNWSIQGVLIIIFLGFSAVVCLVEKLEPLFSLSVFNQIESAYDTLY